MLYSLELISIGKVLGAMVLILVVMDALFFDIVHHNYGAIQSMS